MKKRKRILSIQKNNIFYIYISKIKRFVENKILKSKTNILLLLLIIFLILYASIKLKLIFFVGLLSLIGSLSMIYIRYVPELYVTGVELCMMATVLCAKVYGSTVGSFVGFFSLTAAFVISGRIKYTYFISILALTIVGFIVPYFNLSITTLGITMTIIYDLIVLPLYVLTGSRIPSSIIYFISHVLFNYWVFSNLAPIILKWMI